MTEDSWSPRIGFIYGLTTAIENNDLDMVQGLIRRKADVNDRAHNRRKRVTNQNRFDLVLTSPADSTDRVSCL